MLNFDSLIDDGASPLMVDEYIRNNSYVDHCDSKSFIQVVEKFKRIQSEYNDPIYINGLLNHYHYVVEHEGKTLNIDLYFKIVFVGRKKAVWETLHENIDIRGFVQADSMNIPYGLELDRYTIS